MAVLPDDYNNLAADCKGREQDPCSCNQHEDQILPKRESCPYAECATTLTIPEKRNVKEGGKQEKEEKQSDGKSSGN